MRIAIDGRTIAPGRTGVGEYAENVVRCLLEIDPANQYFLFLAHPMEDLQAPNLTKILIEGYERMVLNRVWENILLPRFTRRNAIDLYFSPAYALPFLPRFGKALRYVPLPAAARSLFNTRKSVKYVATIHDVIGYLYPQYFTPKMRMWTKLFVSTAASLADRILADSETTRRDLLKLYPRLDERRVTVVYPPLNPCYARVSDRARLEGVRSKYGLTRAFVLYLGTIEPRKNVLGLAQAYDSLPEGTKSSVDLIIGGAKGWYAETIVQAIGQMSSAGRIRFTGYVDKEDLAPLYSMAEIFVFPSHYEGFGLPPLEAMACGCPVIVSERASLREVTADAALYIDPDNVSDISREMERLLNDAALRKELSSRGMERAKEFEWKKIVAALPPLFEEVVHSRE